MCRGSDILRNARVSQQGVDFAKSRRSPALRDPYLQHLHIMSDVLAPLPHHVSRQRACVGGKRAHEAVGEITGSYTTKDKWVYKRAKSDKQDRM
jgi:hypothetical protein